MGSYDIFYRHCTYVYGRRDTKWPKFAIIFALILAASCSRASDGMILMLPNYLLGMKLMRWKISTRARSFSHSGCQFSAYRAQPPFPASQFQDGECCISASRKTRLASDTGKAGRISLPCLSTSGLRVTYGRVGKLHY